MAEEPKQPAPLPEPVAAEDAHHGLDAAGQSLGDALRWSFRIVTAVIIVLLGFYVFSGVFTVGPDERVLVLRFGRADRVVKEGMKFALPYPFEQKISIHIGSQDIMVNTFWPRVTEEERENYIREGAEDHPRYVEGALDGKLLTGDLNILEAQFAVTYKVINDSPEIIKYYNTVGMMEGITRSDKERYAQEQKLIRTIVESVVVRRITRLPVMDAILLKDTLYAYPTIKEQANEILADLDCGLEITKINVEKLVPPQPVKDAFDLQLKAAQNASSSEKEAEAYARRTLIGAAGDVGVELGKAFEDWWRARDALKAAEEKLADTEHRDLELEKQAAQCKAAFAEAGEKISELFKKAKGEADNILEGAKAYSARIKAETQADADRLSKLEKQYEQSPEAVKMLLENIHVDAMQRILRNSEENFVLRSGDNVDETLELWLDRHPDLIKKRDKIEKSR